MFGLNLLKNTIATLAANVIGLAGTVKEIDTNLRQRAALDGPDSAESLTLAHQCCPPSFRKNPAPRAAPRSPPRRQRVGATDGATPSKK